MIFIHVAGHHSTNASGGIYGVKCHVESLQESKSINSQCHFPEGLTSEPLSESWKVALSVD